MNCPECTHPPDDGEHLIQIPPRLQGGPLEVRHAAVCRDCLWDIASRTQVPRPGARLVWNSEGDRQSLAGEDVHCGRGLELYMGGGKWMRVRYETTRRDASKGKLFRPVLYLQRSKDAEHVRERNALMALVDNEFSTHCPLGVLHPDDDARFRWPGAL